MRHRFNRLKHPNSQTYAALVPYLAKCMARGCRLDDALYVPFAVAGASVKNDANPLRRITQCSVSMWSCEVAAMRHNHNARDKHP